MVRVSLFYDRDIKQQMFMVRGDERYARSTKITLELGTSVNHEENFDLPIHVNVYRDVGEGSIVIYDNEEVFTVIDDWTSTDTGRSITLYELNYDIDHILQAKYIGNERCSPSLSKTETIKVNNPNVTNAVIGFDIVSTTGSQLTAQISLSNTLSQSYNKNQDIQVYYDDTLIDTYNTGDTGVIEVTYSSLGDNGLHQLKAVFEGSNHLSEATNTYNISVGYKLDVLEYPAIVFNGEQATFKVKLSDYLDNPIANQGVTAYSYVGETAYSLGSDTSDTDGIAEITSTINMATCGGAFNFKSSGATDSDMINVDIVNVTSIRLTADDEEFLFTGEENRFYATINQQIANVPVTFNEEYTSRTETAVTNSNGVAQLTVIGGRGIGNNNWTASCGGKTSNELYLEQYAQYWYPRNIHGRDYILDNGAMLDLQNGFKMTTPSNIANYLTIPVPNGESYELEIRDVVSKTNNTVRQIGFVKADGSVINFNANNIHLWVSRSSGGRVRISDSWGNEYRFDNQGDSSPKFKFVEAVSFSSLGLSWSLSM